MKRLKQITAMIGVIVLIALYVITLVLAVIGSDQSMQLFKAALYASVILPVLLWAYSFIYKLLKNNYSPEARERLEKLKKDAKGSSADTEKEEN